MKVVIVGGGPVACIVAHQFCVRGAEVAVYDRISDPREWVSLSRHSFNLTLSLRGIRTLQPQLRDVLYGHGVILPQRVIHHVDGTVSYQPYGTAEDHHLLSIPRGLLHGALLSEAESAGVKFFFNHECAQVDTRCASAVFVVGDTLHRVDADLLVGCDGANSIVRHEMSRNGARLDVQQQFIDHGYVEMRMPASVSGEHSLRAALQDETKPESARHGLHLWPRDDFMLLAQPNRDHTYTTSLFMPLHSSRSARRSFSRLTTARQVETFFRENFPTAVKLLPNLTEEFFSGPPAPLKIIRSGLFHHGKTIIMGDAAHTMVPFYGQGINCSFEDVHTFFEMYDHLRRGSGFDLTELLGEFTKARMPAIEAITDLSLANLQELASHVGQNHFQERSALERELHRRHPDRFASLYQRVAFSTMPYHEAVAQHERDRQLLDELFSRFDSVTQYEEILRSFAESVGGVQ